MNEFANVAFRKQGLGWHDIRALTQAFETLADTVLPIGSATHFEALDLAEEYQLSFYDALMLATALEAGCEVFYSEDLHNGLLIRGRLRILDPFQSPAGPASQNAAP
ncbi:PIN domain-containing protein [Rhizobium sp. NRK18]|uniref:PIN domain-containing protein n=1 Tax=Rhizobium sp. NRK18 TaxID=2964667 RepID=UPI0021C30F2C|nr:PIN domain-containing protein [Rhizobium sp. NRK18]MCQ2005139.1 PIN domain-containing protein [Rhizobium sp. NRK18]